MNRERLIFILLLIFLLASAGYFGKALFYTVPSPLPRETTEKPVMATVTGKKVRTRTDYSVIRAKNVFHPDRANVPKGAASTGPVVRDVPVEPPPQLALKGIVQDSRGEFIAYVTVDSEKARPIRTGERIDNLKVVSITMTDVTIRWSEQEIKLTLSKVKSVGKQGK